MLSLWTRSQIDSALIRDSERPCHSIVARFNEPFTHFPPRTEGVKGGEGTVDSEIDKK